jgi:hypothetical protein
MQRSDALLISVAWVLLAPGIILTAADLFPLPPQVDFAAYYLAAGALRAGWDPYDPQVLAQLASTAGVPEYTPYIYPPLLAVIVMPLAALPYHIAAAIWLALSAAALVCALTILRSIVDIPDRVFPAVVAAAFVFPAAHHTFELGQINHFLLLVIAGAAITSQAHVAGALIGIAAAMKVFPAAIGGAFLVTKNYRGLSAAIISGLVVTAASIASPASHRALAEWIHHVLPEIDEQRLITPNNQSAPAVLARLFTHHRFEGAAIGGDTAWVALAPVIDAPHIVPIVSAATVLVIGLVTLLALIRSRNAEGAAARVAQTGAIVAALLIAMPVVWDHYYVLLLVPLAALYSSAAAPLLRLAGIGVILLLAHRYWRLTIHLGSPLLLSAGLAGTLAIWAALLRHLKTLSRHGLRSAEKA